MAKRIRTSAFVLTAIAIVAASIYVGSCIVAVTKLAAAARAGDAPGVLSRTDLPRLRRSLATQILAAYERRAGTSKTSNMLRQLLQSATPTIADQVAARFLTEARLSELIGKGSVTIGSTAQTSAMPPLSNLTISDAVSRVRFVQPVTFSFRAGPSTETSYVALMHFENFEWRLAGLEMPEAVIEKIAASIR